MSQSLNWPKGSRFNFIFCPKKGLLQPPILPIISSDMPHTRNLRHISSVLAQGLHCLTLYMYYLVTHVKKLVASNPGLLPPFLSLGVKRSRNFFPRGGRRPGFEARNWYIECKGCGDPWNEMAEYPLKLFLSIDKTNSSVPQSLSKPVYLHNVICSRSDLTLLECSFTKYSGNINDIQDVIIHCQQCKCTDLYLTNNPQFYITCPLS